MRPVFHKSTHYWDTNKLLRSIAGPVDRLSEFQPVYSEALDTIVRFLRILFDYNICCFLGGSFVCHTAGIATTYSSAVLYVALDMHQSLNRVLFQRRFSSNV